MGLPCQIKTKKYLFYFWFLVFLNNVSHSALKDLIQFMYCGEVNVKQDALPAFISTAESLQIKGLTDVSIANTHTHTHSNIKENTYTTKRLSRAQTCTENWCTQTHKIVCIRAGLTVLYPSNREVSGNSRYVCVWVCICDRVSVCARAKSVAYSCLALSAWLNGRTLVVVLLYLTRPTTNVPNMILQTF